MELSGMAAEAERLAGLNARLMRRLTERLDGLTLNGDAERRIPGNLNIGFAGVAAEALMEACPGLALSTGSACTSASVEPSYVLRALGLTDEAAGSSLRIGLGRFTGGGDLFGGAVTRLRGWSKRAAE